MTELTVDSVSAELIFISSFLCSTYSIDLSSILSLNVTFSILVPCRFVCVGDFERKVVYGLGILTLPNVVEVNRPLCGKLMCCPLISKEMLDGTRQAIPKARGVNVSDACSEELSMCENHRPLGSWEEFYGTCSMRLLTWTLPAFSLEPGKGMVRVMKLRRNFKNAGPQQCNLLYQSMPKSDSNTAGYDLRCSPRTLEAAELGLTRRAAKCLNIRLLQIGVKLTMRC